MPAPLIALDLFAGTGWGVACQRLGIYEDGVEIMPEAVATREANGMTTIFRDVWDGLEGNVGARAVDTLARYNLLIASPPCQTFSMAGKGAGRKALDDVLGLIRSGAYRDPAALREFGDTHDPRTALVLTPLAYAVRDLPTFIAFEQVPTVLPVWEACAEELRGLGYSVAVGVLNAEQYGVPQTRRRAILVARRDGVEAKLPTPTHSRYYSRDPERLDEGVLPWVSMAEALGWGMTRRPYPTVASGTDAGGTDPAALGGSGARRTVYRERASGAWAPSGDADNDGGILRLTAEEAAAIQSYPEVLTANNKLAHASTRPVTHPAPTLTAGHDSGNRQWLPAGRPVTVEEAAALQSYPTAVKRMGSGMVERHGDRPGRPGTEPAFTIRASAGGTEPGGFILREEGGEERKLTADQAAMLQSYERPFVWKGSKTKRFLQVGNAVPPLLAEAVLSTFL